MEIIDIGKARIVVSSTRVSGRDYVDIRAYVTDGTGVLKPTSTGILLPVEKCDDVLGAADRACKEALAKEPAPLYYFQESVQNKTEPRHAPMWQTSATARDATRRTPDEYGADSRKGYIFKCSDYQLINSTYRFSPTKPFAVWDVERSKWVRWEKRVPKKKTIRIAAR